MKIFATTFIVLIVLVGGFFIWKHNMTSPTSKAGARAIAEEKAREATEQNRHTVVITKSEKTDKDWIFYLDNEEHIKSGNILDSIPGLYPILVRPDGTVENVRPGMVQVK